MAVWTPRWICQLVVWSLASLLVVQASSASGDSNSADRILPSGEDVEVSVPADIYPGDYLFDYINGGAPHYLEYGFIEVASQELALNERTYIFDVYRMASPLAAWGIFSTRRPPGAPTLEGLPFSSFTPYQALVAHGPYHFDISAYESDDTTAREMARLAWMAVNRVAAELSAGDLFAGPPFTRLPGSGRLPGSERLARGPISLRAALAGTGDEPFRRAIEAVLAVLEAETRTQNGAEIPAAAPWWVISGYHLLEDDAGRLVPQTTLAVLVTRGDPIPVLRAGSAALAGCEGLSELPADRGWRWQSGAVLQRGGDLLVAATVLDPDHFRAWTDGLLER